MHTPVFQGRQEVDSAGSSKGSDLTITSVLPPSTLAYTALSTHSTNSQFPTHSAFQFPSTLQVGLLLPSSHPCQQVSQHFNFYNSPDFQEVNPR
jgi:hypothetical protein